MHDFLSRFRTIPAACALLASAAAMPSQAQTFTVIHAFKGGADGMNPMGSPVLYNGNLYGTTKGGGILNAGTVYEVNFASRNESILHAFAGAPADGASPLAGLIQDAAGNLYGTTFYGGANNRGTIFELASAGKGVYTILHSLAGPTAEGSGPTAPLTFDSFNNLYGTTYQGGTSKYGTTFELTAGGVFSTGQNFPPDGALPHGALVHFGGVFYGTTAGSVALSYGGTIFQSGNSTALYTFTGGADGAAPMAGLFASPNGYLYGTASAGGSAAFGLGNGTVFKFNPANNQLTVLHTFTGADGSAPMCSLYPDSQGNLYGTTLFGGAGYGTVFKLDPSGNLTTVYSFTGGSDGAFPASGVVVDAKGNIFGTASAGGASGGGTLYVIAAPAAR